MVTVELPKTSPFSMMLRLQIGSSGSHVLGSGILHTRTGLLTRARQGMFQRGQNIMNQPSPRPPATNEQGTPECCHRWDIKPANGPSSQGTCQNCGEVRKFKNFIGATRWKWR